MCGIAGFINQTIDAQTVIRHMTDRMIHRGPDAQGAWCDERSGLVLGHRRLSIIDLSENGAQPMISANQRYVIAYNGEIYNADVIRQKIRENDPSFRFRGTSDTEVILESFDRFGVPQTLAMMKGMFAVALYDREEKTLYLMRDRAGEKPLYYGFVEGHFVFASDVDVLNGYPDFVRTKKISRTALAEYMRYGYVPAPYSIYEGIYKLAPGSVLTLHEPFDRVELRTYWSMAEAALQGEQNIFQGSFREACDELEKLLLSSVHSQMVSDVPIGAFLSGGIDSPLIVSLMQQQSASAVKTFTIGFEEKKYNEAEYAAEIAKHLGTEHTQLYVSEQELLDVIPKLADIFTEPFADSSQIPTYLVSRLARSRVTVSLSGDAGDELFCGYNTYSKIAGLWAKERRIPFGMRKLMAGGVELLPYGKTAKGFRIAQSLRANDIGALHEAVCYHTSYYGEHCVCGAYEKPDIAEWIACKNEKADIAEWITCKDEKNTMLLKDAVTYHPDDILVKVDRAGMAVSLENRVPMLDKDVIEFAFRLPRRYKDGVGLTRQEYSELLFETQRVEACPKAILKAVLYRYVPKQMLDRPKKGFSVPLKRWLSEGKTHEWARELIADSRLVRDSYFDKAAVEHLWKDFMNGKSDAQMVWQILMAEQWYRNGADQ